MTEQTRGGKRPIFANALTTRIVLFFARNPDELLSANDVVLKWNCTLINAQRALYNLKLSGLVAVHSRAYKSIKRGKQAYNIYTAGPALLQAID